MVAAEYFGVDRSVFQLRPEPVGDEEVVYAPARVLLSCTETVAPPTVGDLLRIQSSERICKAIVQQLCHFASFFVSKACTTSVCFGIL